MFFFTSIFQGFLSQLGWIWGSKLRFIKVIFFDFSRTFVQERSKSVPRAPKSVPRVPQERPKSTQECPKSAPRAPQERPRGVLRRSGEPSGTLWRLGSATKSAFRRRSIARLAREASSGRFFDDFRVVRSKAEPWF